LAVNNLFIDLAANPILMHNFNIFLALIFSGAVIAYLFFAYVEKKVFVLFFLPTD